MDKVTVHDSNANDPEDVERGAGSVGCVLHHLNGCTEHVLRSVISVSVMAGRVTPWHNELTETLQYDDGARVPCIIERAA